jgi:hypothetical protein
MTLVLLLIIPLFTALIVLTCKEPGRAVRVALCAGAFEVAAIANAIWRIRNAGATCGLTASPPSSC